MAKILTRPVNAFTSYKAPMFKYLKIMPKAYPQLIRQ
jgi:hypothetical protein